MPNSGRLRRLDEIRFPRYLLGRTRREQKRALNTRERGIKRGGVVKIPVDELDVSFPRQLHTLTVTHYRARSYTLSGQLCDNHPSVRSGRSCNQNHNSCPSHRYRLALG
jgi:hypothetical protein